MSKLVEVDVPVRDLNNFDHGDDTCIQEVLDTLNASIPKYSEGLRRGDLVHVTQLGNYGNDGKYIFDGEKFINMCYDNDDYGHIDPSLEVISEFPITWWKDTMSHDCLVFYTLTSDERKAIIANIHWFTCCEAKSYFEKNGATYHVIVAIDCEVCTEDEARAALNENLNGVFRYASNILPEQDEPNDSTLYIDITL